MTITWNYVAATEDTDAAHTIEGREDFEIQVGGRSRFHVNEYGFDVPGDYDTFWSKDRGTFKKLDDAKAYVLTLIA